MSLLKTNQEDDGTVTLTPEEYNMALEAEMVTWRKKYYVGGVIKPNNLIVPWKPVDEKEIAKEARKVLLRNGIKDPEAPEEAEDEDVLTLDLNGKDAVQLTWTCNVGAKKIGYIVERKRAKDMNFQEISTYDGMQNQALICNGLSGASYDFEDLQPPPGSVTYRVLCRQRSGEIKVVDMKTIEVPSSEETGVQTAIAFLLFLFGGGFAAGFLKDPGATYD